MPGTFPAPEAVGAGGDEALESPGGPGWRSGGQTQAGAMVGGAQEGGRGGDPLRAVASSVGERY